MLEVLPRVTTGGSEERVAETVPGAISFTLRLTGDDWLDGPPTVWDIALRNMGYVPTLFPVIVQFG